MQALAPPASRPCATSRRAARGARASALGGGQSVSVASLEAQVRRQQVGGNPKGCLTPAPQAPATATEEVVRWFRHPALSEAKVETLLQKARPFLPGAGSRRPPPFAAC